MKNSLFGVIIKVNNIDLCRNFYRNVLNLGNPVVDSSFVVEFQISNEFFLMLEKTDARFLEHESSATSWSYRVDNIEELLYRSRLHGYKLNMEKRSHEGEILYRCQDPEKNIFYIFNNAPEDSAS
jgi:predicted enzyme related to lactoylglutathione lyase